MKGNQCKFVKFRPQKMDVKGGGGGGGSDLILKVGGGGDVS